MREFRRSLFIFLAIVGTAVAQEQFSGTEAAGYVTQLCSPEFSGRKTGQPGAHKAAEWIAGQFHRWGLRAGGDSDSYLQRVQMLITNQTTTAHLSLLDGSFSPITYQEGNDFTVYFNSGSGSLTADVVFVGLGISEPAKGRDDYAGVDVKGKIILIDRSVPDDGRDWSAENERDYKMRKAAEHGAAAVLMVEREFAIRGGTIHEEGYYPSMPSYAISRKVAYDIFRMTFKNMDLTFRQCTKKPVSFSFGKRMSLDVTVVQDPKGYGENVIGIVPGTDPVLKHEYIVMGGHMDHNGISPDGHAYYGADDNASGASTVMELGRYFSLPGHATKRTLVFITFGGEEQGLRGSHYFTLHPTVPFDHIVSMSNFDMVGVGDGAGAIGGRNLFPDVVEQVVANLPDSVQKKLHVGRGGGFGGSDHSYFVTKGVPSFGFFSTGEHPFYHQEEDLPSQINPQSLQFVGDRAVNVITALGNSNNSLLFSGTRTGREYLLFGDQIDFSRKEGSVPVFEAMKPSDADLMAERGIRASVCAIQDLLPTNGSITDIVAGENRLTAAHHDLLLAVKNGGSLNTAAGGQKFGVAFVADGSGILGGRSSNEQILARNGLLMIRLSNPIDPVFQFDSLSQFGRDVFKIAQDEHSGILWEVPDSTLTNHVVRATKTRIALRVPAELAQQYVSYISDPVEKRTLLIVTCKPSTDPKLLVSLMKETDARNIHFECIAHSDAEFVELSKMIQSVYSERLRSLPEENVYYELTRALGDNLKKFLD